MATEIIVASLKVALRCASYKKRPSIATLIGALVEVKQERNWFGKMSSVRAWGETAVEQPVHTLMVDRARRPWQS
jgi:hypothetical protein